jgi:hypothetical protein
MQTRREKEIIIENRKFRDQQYDERRQQDFQDALQWEHQAAKQLREEYLRQASLQLAQHQEVQEKKQAAKRQKHKEFCQDLVHQLLQLSCKVR